MSFSVKTTASIVKTVANVSQIIYAIDKTVSSGEEVIKTFLVNPQTATEYIKVNLDPFTINPNITSVLLLVKTTKQINLKVNVGDGMTEPSSGDVLTFQGIPVTDFVILSGNVKNLYFNRIPGDIDVAEVQITLW